MGFIVIGILTVLGIIFAICKPNKDKPQFDIAKEYQMY